MSAATSNAIFYPNLPLSVIIESAHNPRKRFDPAKLAELAENIRERGVDVPVTVREVEMPEGTRFELAAGHRRCRAARLAGLVEVPALIRTLSDREFLEVLHIDNLQREGLDPLDEALGYEQLLKEGGYDTSTLATKIGRSLTYVLSRVRLLSLGVAAREALARGYLPLSHAIEVAKLPENVQGIILEEEFLLNVEALVTAATGASEEATDVEASTTGDDDEVDDDAEINGAESDGWIEDKPPVDPFSINRWSSPQAPTLAELKHTLKTQVYRRLNVVPWSLTDTELVPTAGACANCSKRSGAEPLLFAELDAGTDACLDQTCYDAKHEAFTQLQGLGKAKTRVVGAVLDEESEEEHEQNHERQLEQRAADDKARQKAAAKARRERTIAVAAVLDEVGYAVLTDADWLNVILWSCYQGVHSDRLYAAFDRAGIAPPGGYRNITECRLDFEEYLTTASLDEKAQLLVLYAMNDDILVREWQLSTPTEKLDEFQRLVAVDAMQLTGVQ